MMHSTSESSLQLQHNPTFQDGVNGTYGVNSNPGERYAIAVRHARIQYKDVVRALVSGAAPTINVVINDFNMNVKKGHIYGLLGASGCGKTSILRAIVGQVDLTSGHIRVLGHAPKTPQSGVPGTTVGYMPQELSLIGAFTIKELLTFYGRIGGMNSEEIDDRCSYLAKLLELPKTNRIIETLSCGQQRRVSFAIALIHSPPILILDEPTVGVDPLLRESIWEFLKKVTKTKETTVLITTHYIEEANQTDTVGLIRHGKLMAEQSPKSLKDSLNCSNLEDVLVELCVLQSTKGQSTSSFSSNHAIRLPGIHRVADDDVVSFEEEKSFLVRRKVSSTERVRALVWKTALSYLRHYGVLIMIIMHPLICMTLFCISFGNTLQDIKISVFNQEKNCSLDGVIVPNQYGNSTNCGMPTFLSCKILEELKQRGILPVPFQSESTAKQSVRIGQSWGAVTISNDFTSALLQRAGYTSPLGVPDDVLDKGSVQVTMDQSDQIISNYVKSEMLQSLTKVLTEVNAVCHNLGQMIDLPIQFQTPIYGDSDTNMIDTVVPGLVSGFGMMNPLTAAIATLLPEKASGSLERGLVGGVRMGEVVLSHFLVSFFPSCIAISLVVAIPYVFFGLVMNGSFWTIAVLLFFLEVCGLLFGYILAVICGTVSIALLIGLSFYFTIFFTSGTIWPVEGVYPYLRPFCWASTLTLPTEAIRFIAVRGWSFHNKAVQNALISTVLWSCALLILLFKQIRAKQ